MTYGVFVAKCIKGGVIILIARWESSDEHMVIMYESTSPIREGRARKVGELL